MFFLLVNFFVFTWLFPLKSKYDVFICFIKFKSLVENMLSSKMNTFQSDGRGEYIINIYNSKISFLQMAYFIAFHLYGLFSLFCS
jgi:hypothetical protein